MRAYANPATLNRQVGGSIPPASTMMSPAKFVKIIRGKGCAPLNCPLICCALQASFDGQELPFLKPEGEADL